MKKDKQQLYKHASFLRHIARQYAASRELGDGQLMGLLAVAIDLEIFADHRPEARA